VSETTGRHVLKRPLTIKLTSSAGEREQQITEITVKPIENAGQLLCLDGAGDGAIAQTFALLSELTGHPVKVLQGLHPHDFKVLAGYVSDFL
jgi:hypothetical protein